MLKVDKVEATTGQSCSVQPLSGMMISMVHNEHSISAVQACQSLSHKPRPNISNQNVLAVLLVTGFPLEVCMNRLEEPSYFELQHNAAGVLGMSEHPLKGSVEAMINCDSAGGCCLVCNTNCNTYCGHCKNGFGVCVYICNICCEDHFMQLCCRNENGRKMRSEIPASCSACMNHICAR